MARECGPPRLTRRVPIFREIAPFDILSLDQFYLPGALVFLEARFSIDCIIDVAELLKIDEPRHAILPGECGARSLTVLKDAAHQLVRHADVQRSVR